MPGLLPDIDPEGLLEYSVVFTDRALNHMSKRFQKVMRDISQSLKDVYKAEQVALVPGGGSAAMESVARQFGRDARVLVVRNGFFSYRWSQIFETGGFAREVSVVMARATGNESQASFSPPPIEEVVARIRDEKPQAVFAPHVETAAGMILPDDYITKMAAAAHEVGALMVLDCIASGTIWVDMQATGVDVLISAPQKGWSASPSAGMVMLSAAGAKRLEETTGDSFFLDLKKWRAIVAAYENGGHAYHATMPTDAIVGLWNAIEETRALGFDKAKAAQWELGDKVRAYLREKGIRLLAAEGFGAPGVVVAYTTDPEIQNGSKFAAKGVQIAAGVPLQVGEGPDFRTFRIGLFGLDKLKDVDGAFDRLKSVADDIL